MRLFIMIILLFQYSYCWSESWVQVGSREPVFPGSSMYSYSYSFSWPYESGNDIVAACQTGCIINPFYVGGQIYQGSDHILIIHASDNCYNMKCIWDKWVKTHGASGSDIMNTVQPGAGTSCWSFLAFPFSGTYPTGAGLALPGAACGIAPPVNVKCNISLNDIDHGVLKPSNINGSTKSEIGRLECNADASVQLTLGAGDKVHLYSNGVNIIDSDIYINDYKVGRGGAVNVNAINGTTTITIKSVLQSVSSPIGGEFIGSDVILMSIY
ncbi:hypothetical protein [Serratia marcescens]|uniref:MrpH family fimbial adhesin n=1 Tax=Serratia marcescens TaxID=615 RepID=UPI00111561EB|nr:hypothetical protein [Serratia marcescens]